MILDGKIQGYLDQEKGVLILLQKTELDPLYKDSAEILDNMSEAVKELFVRANKIKSF